jgi:tetratricopeptide (TPR) repeat protein
MSHNVCRFALAVCLFAWCSPLRADGQEEAKQLVEKAKEQAKTNKLDEAIAAMRKAIQLDPKNDLYLGMVSDFELRAGKFADGLKHARQAIKLNDKDGAYHMLACACAYGGHDVEEARKYCEHVLKGGPRTFGPGPYKGALVLQDLLYKKTYTLYWKLDPEKGRLANGRFAVALPKTGLPYQTVTYEVTGAKSHRFVKGDVNDIVYIVPDGNRTIALTTRVAVEPYSYKKELAKQTSKPLSVEARANLGPCLTINPKSAALTKVVADLKGSTSVETARNISAWMRKNVEYKSDKTDIVGLDFKNVDEIVERGHAECRGHALLFVGLCRAAGIPARPIWGLTRVTPEQDQRYGKIASHSWAEFYVSGVGWVPVDPQRPETLGFLPTSLIRLFMDAQKSKTSMETLPVLNLFAMNGGTLKFDEQLDAKRK